MIENTSLARSTELTNAIETAARHENSSDKHLQRANGACRIVVSGSARGTRMVDLYEKSPIRVLFPKTENNRSMEAVLVNMSGGVAGGDELQASVTALSGASIGVTTQAAEKVYRALSESSNITMKLSVGESAKLAWLPQETIVFDRARVRRRTEIDIASGSELLALEWIVLGRAAHGENISTGAILDTWQVRRNGRLQWCDTLRLSDDVFCHLSRRALLGASKSVATLLYFGPELADRLQLIRAQCGSRNCQWGATLVGGMVVVRLAAPSSFELKAAIRNLLQELGNELAPGPFRIPKMWAC